MTLEERYTQIDTAERMADAATAFLASLRSDQAAMAQRPFGDENAETKPRASCVGYACACACA